MSEIPDASGAPDVDDVPVKPKVPAQRSRKPDELAAEVAANRERLAATIDTLVERARPGSVASRTMERVRQYFVTADGELRMSRVGLLGAGALGAVIMVVALRRARR